jgi:hypothetical protein
MNRECGDNMVCSFSLLFETVYTSRRLRFLLLLVAQIGPQVGMSFVVVLSMV